MRELMDALFTGKSLSDLTAVLEKILDLYTDAFARARSSIYKVRRRGGADIDKLAVEMQKAKTIAFRIPGGEAAVEKFKADLEIIEMEEREFLSKR